MFAAKCVFRDTLDAAAEASATLRHRILPGIEINLCNVGMLADRTGDLLLSVAPAEPTKGERVASVVDTRRFGPETVTHGINQPHHGFFERA